MPALLISFFMYGIFPIMCKYMKLVADVSPYVTKRQRSINQRSASVAMGGNASPFADTANPKSRALSDSQLDSPTREEPNTSSKMTSVQEKQTEEQE